MSVKSSYYDILEISTEATDEEIRKAYRKQALQWHPDKNNHRLEEAEVKFKEIAEAYEILSDPEKRQIYDTYGEEGLKNGGASAFPETNGMFPGFVFHDPEEIFRQFFGINFGTALFNDPFFTGGQQQTHPTDPFGRPFGHTFGTHTFGTHPFGTHPFGTNPFGALSFGALPFGGFPSLGNTFGSSTYTSFNSFSGGNGSGFITESSTTTISNGIRTTTIKRTDAQGNVTLITESSDGTRTETINGQASQYRIMNNQQKYG
ncbi:57_t:CDS:2 [Paraglomus occultum]|uniref:57_t:CDS:1 n=1 Tax=Paraglomus occultum TaxID=144539 RepID=A0A9N9DRL2_9GLOM|nr:57_t:CDS:2 [Paraglomus occultum]